MADSAAGFMSSDWLGAFLIIAILFGGGFGIGGGNRGPAPNFATVQDVNEAVNNQGIQNGIQNILLSSANNNYETARLIDNQTMFLSNQNNTNTLAAINGFNDIKQTLGQISAQMNECCCSIKTMMLEQELKRTQTELQDAKTANAINQQSQYLLGVMGKWVANAPATAG